MINLICLLFVLLFSGQGLQSTAQEEIVKDTQRLFDAVAPGNKEPWDKYVADDVMYFDEQGHNMDKQALLSTIQGLPTGLSGTIKVANSKINLQGNTLIHSYDMDETETVFGQEVHARYHATDTWMNRSHGWQIVAGQVLRYYEDPAPAAADVGKFRDYVGTYEMGGQREVVSVENGKLYLKRGTRAPVELIPESCDIFFRKGIEGRQLFRYGDGKVSSLIDRRNNEDIVWQRVP
jgi:hypothetical protein